VNERPFRVNAGAVHMYTLLPSGKTAYLSEVEAGTEIMILGHDGHGEVAWVGRSKIERRPLLLIRGDVGGTEVSAVLQNAETIRLIAPDGQQVSVSDLERGVEVLCYTEKGGRHFGIKIEETIQEK
jgi:3-dehydroquinate synthase II